MATNNFQTDFKLTTTVQDPNTQNTDERVTLSISTSGDLELVQGRPELAQQMLRALVNDQVQLQGFLNAKQIRNVSALITVILRSFRQQQVFATEKSNPNLDGFIIYRYGGPITSDQFVQISQDPVQYAFTDTKVTNGTEYTYGLAKSYAKGLSITQISEQLDVTPTAFAHKQEVVTGKEFIAIPGNGSVTFYVDYSRLFLRSELLDVIETIEILEDKTEPRRAIVNVTVRDLDNNFLTLSSQKYPIIT